MTAAGTRMRAGFACGVLAIAFLLSALGDPPPAHAAAKELVAIQIPQPGQLAIARLEFKVKGVAKPKLKLKAKNKDELPDSLVAAAQAARYEDKRRRAVAFVAMADAPSPVSAVAANETRGLSDQLILQSHTESVRATDLKFLETAELSRVLASVLGADVPEERALARRVFDLEEGELPTDDFGVPDSFRFFLREMELIRTRNAALLDGTELEPDHLLGSGVAAAVGPPAAIHSSVYTYATAWPAPEKIGETASLSPSNPNIGNVGVAYNRPVMGAQVSPASDNDIVQTPDARCDDGELRPGTVTFGAGPVLPSGQTVRMDCALQMPDEIFLGTVPMQRMPMPGEEALRIVPSPMYPDGQFGEAVGSESSTFRVRF